MADIDKNTEIEIIEYPKNNKDEFKNKNELQLKLIFDLMPKSLKKELEYLNVMPILNGEHIYFMIPHHIEIN